MKRQGRKLNTAGCPDSASSAHNFSMTSKRIEHQKYPTKYRRYGVVGEHGGLSTQRQGLGPPYRFDVAIWCNSKHIDSHVPETEGSIPVAAIDLHPA